MGNFGQIGNSSSCSLKATVVVCICFFVKETRLLGGESQHFSSLKRDLKRGFSLHVVKKKVKRYMDKKVSLHYIVDTKAN